MVSVFRVWGGKMAFWGMKRYDDSENDKIIKLERDVGQLKRDVMDISISLDNLRDKILKRVKVRKDETDTEPQDLYKGMLLKE